MTGETEREREREREGEGDPPRFVLVGGNTETARIDGISAAGADPESMVHTPAADLEIVEYGRPTGAPVVPVSPTGCPTPAVVTRAVRELVGFETLAVDAGLARPTTAPTVAVDAEVGGDVRDPRPVGSAAGIFEAARGLGRSLPDGELLIGETIPGGTTTALGVLTALGERPTVSSSLPENPFALKREVVGDALAASDLSAGDAAGNPIEAIERVGDPVLAAVAGLAIGGIDAGTPVTLAGGTQMAAAAALVRHASADADTNTTRDADGRGWGMDGNGREAADGNGRETDGNAAPALSIATTSFVADDGTAALRELAADLDLPVAVTDPGFERADHPALEAYVAGEAKEGVGMGGALALADRRSVPMADVRERTVAVYERLGADGRRPDP